MKKLFWIPLFVILAVIPMIAGAVPVVGEPVAGNAGSPTATNAPKYALEDAGAGDEKAALASYVKGAYNAVIKGINNTQDEIDTLNSGIEIYSDAIGHLTDGKATKAGTVATIKSAKTNESIATSSVQFNNVTTTSISATASVNVNLSVPIMGDWETDSLAENPIETTAGFTNLPVENLAMSAPTTNTAKLTKSGITGSVNTAKYLAYDYTRLIGVRGNRNGYKNVDGSVSERADGLENSEWKVSWDDYGTAMGIAICSSTGNNAEFDQFATVATLGTNGDTKSCWCKLTGFTDKDGTIYNDTSLFVFLNLYRQDSICAYNCVIYCAESVRTNSTIRSSIFGSIQ